MSNLRNLIVFGGDSGGTPPEPPTLIEKSITANGVYTASDDSADGYSKVTANIPNTYTQSDEGKVVSNGALVAQTANVPVTTNGTVDTTLISSVDVNVSTGGGASRSDVNFYDYDGTIVNSYSKSEFLALTEMPANPSHEGLTAQGWNWSLSDAKTYVSSYGKLEIGQMYTTSDGATKLHIHLEEGRLAPVLGLCPNGTLTIDWGDGSATETMTGSSASTLVYLPHTYAQAGNYTISITPSSGSSFGFGIRGGMSSALCKSSTDSLAERKVYLNVIVGISIGSGITSIGSAAFSGCYSLTSITIPSSVTSIGDTAFRYCYSLTSITIPSSVSSIGSYAFDSCYSLTSVTISSGITRIGSATFGNCTSLTSITIPSSVSSIGDTAFSGCYSLTSITIPSSVSSIVSYAFSNCYSLTSITIPSSVSSIGNYAFGNCYSLTSITIPSSVSSIGNYAFSNCYSLTSVTISSGITRIGSAAFSNCYSLTSITIPSSVSSIGDTAFSGCYGLSYIMIDNFQNSIAGSPWGAPSSDTVVIWARVARFTSVTNEVSSGTTLTTSISCAVGDLIVATFVIRADTYTISDDWMLLGISEEVGSLSQRTGMAYKIAESATENLTITQNISGRMYTNLVAITGASIGVFSGFTTQETGATITMNRPSGLVIWGVSSYFWNTSTPYVPWGISNTTDIYAVELPISTQPRCLTALDQGNDSTVSFTYSPGLTGDGALACASLTITGIPNFWDSV